MAFFAEDVHLLARYYFIGVLRFMPVLSLG